MITSSYPNATIVNAMVSQIMEGIMEVGEYASSSVKFSTGLLQAEKDDAREEPRIEEQLHVANRGFTPLLYFQN